MHANLKPLVLEAKLSADGSLTAVLSAESRRKIASALDFRAQQKPRTFVTQDGTTLPVQKKD